MSDPENDYDVGFGKPPKRTQFKKGQSGNAKGRPKGSRNVESMVKEAFFRKITITESGKKKRVTMLEALLRQLVNGAIKGEMRNVDRVFKLLPILQETLEQEKARDQGDTDIDPVADLAILETLADMLGSDPEDLFATVQGGIDDECPEF
ncbi:DUF5681 domain-containing protein [Falsihalocynthiibacter arcticus]|uniref:DUF5681 domain-containing protein n=1 Tax=Falsihalocynthiibacter arcticus TaxID=1579316 RepID=UPI00300111E3